MRCTAIIAINKNTGEGVSYRVKDIKDIDSTPFFQRGNNKVSDIYEDEKGQLWLATDDGLYSFNRAQKIMNRIGPEKVHIGEWADYAFQRICRKEDHLYLGSWGGGLSVYNLTTHKFESYKHNLQRPTSGTDNIIQDVIAKDSNNLWIASADKGLASFNCSTHQFHFFRKEKNNTQIQLFLWNRLVYDKEGNIWALNADGLVKIVTTDYPFQYNIFPVTHTDNQIFYELNDLWEDDNYRLVSLSFGDGIHVINKKTGKHKILSVEYLKQEESVQYAEQIFRDSKNIIWIVTRDYIYQFDYAGQKLIKINQPPLFSSSQISNFFSGIAEDKTGNIWICTGRNGVFIYNPKTTEYHHNIPFTFVINGIKENAPIFSICADKTGRIWLGSRRGFLGYSDGLTETVTEIKSNLFSHKISNLFCDSKGNVWASSDKGLIKLNANENNPSVLKKITTADGVSADLLTGLCEDSKGSIWCISTATRKVYEINENQKQIAAFDAKDGIIGPGGLIKMVHLKNDSIYLLSQGGIYSFCPSMLTKHKPKVSLLMSIMTVNGKEIYFEEIIKQGKEMVLNPNENSFYFEFSAIDFIHPEEYNYAYKLEGYDDHWINIGQRHNISINNLKGGHYKMFIKVSSPKGVLNVPELCIPFYIIIPFYLQWWFILFCTIAVFLLIYGFIRLRFSRQRKIYELENKAHNLEKEKAEIQYENLKQHLNPHFLFNSLTSLSSLIRINQQLAGEFLEGMSKIYRYILQSKDNETVLLKDEIRFVETYIKLQKTRFEKGLEVFINVDEQYSERRVVPVTLQNLIENAIKHNIIDEESPLIIELFIADNYLIVKNNLQLKTFVETSNQQGLESIRSLYNYLSASKVKVEKTKEYFMVKIPLI